MFESPEVFEAYAVIDACYYELQNLYKHISKPKTPIHQMIDEASGFGNAQTKEMKEITISLLQQIIEAKKLIEADYKDTEIWLNEVKKIKV